MRATIALVNELLYDLPREAGFLPEATRALGRGLNARIPYVPESVFDEPLEERRVREIARVHEIRPAMSGDTAAVLFELLARLSHKSCFHSLELLVRRWDANEELPPAVIADAIQPAFSQWWTTTIAEDPVAVIVVANRFFFAVMGDALREAAVECARHELGKIARFVDENRATLARRPQAGPVRAFVTRKLFDTIAGSDAKRLIADALSSPANSAASVLCTDAVARGVVQRGPWTVLPQFVQTNAAFVAQRIECPELRASLVKRS